MTAENMKPSGEQDPVKLMKSAVTMSATGREVTGSLC